MLQINSIINFSMRWQLATIENLWHTNVIVSELRRYSSSCELKKAKLFFFLSNATTTKSYMPNAFNVIRLHSTFTNHSIRYNTKYSIESVYFVFDSHIVLCKWQRTCQYFAHAPNVGNNAERERKGYFHCDISHSQLPRTHTYTEMKRIQSM